MIIGKLNENLGAYLGNFDKIIKICVILRNYWRFKLLLKETMDFR